MQDAVEEDGEEEEANQPVGDMNVPNATLASAAVPTVPSPAARNQGIKDTRRDRLVSKRVSSYTRTIESVGVLDPALARGESRKNRMSSNLELHHDMRFFLLGIGSGLSPSEDICSTLGTSRNIIQNSVQMLLRLLRKATRNFPVLVPEYEWCVGTYAWAEGRVEDAMAHWQNQLLVSKALDMQWQIAVAHFELARVGMDFYNVDLDPLSRSDNADEVITARDHRNMHLAKAKSVCESIKANGLLRRVNEEMRISTKQDCIKFGLRALETEAVGAPLPVFSTLRVGM